MGLRLVQLASEHAGESMGRPLIGMELRIPNSVVRSMLGEAKAAKLDAEITPVAEQLWFHTTMVSFSAFPPSALASRPEPHPIYASTRTSEIAKTFQSSSM